MSLTTTQALNGDLDLLLHGGLSELDITPEEHERVVQRYAGLGAVLDVLWAATLGSNRVFAQGSFMLGTVVRNVSRNDDLDIDLVAVRDIAKPSITQEQLKEEVGEAVNRYARGPKSGFPTVEESSRCWTLTWPDMHMDVLPAIPDDASRVDGLLITDQDVRSWLPSHPEGYARWFRSRMTSQAMASRGIEEKRLDVERVPEWQRRSALQRVVQALKRHRDVYFIDRPNERPSSIVITTLAAHAYTGGRDLQRVLREVVSGMSKYLYFADGEWLLPNPAQRHENFVDSWAAEPWQARRFFEWLDAAESAFLGFETKSGLDQVIPALDAAFGSRFTRGASRGLADYVGNARANGSLRMAGGALSVVGSSAAPLARPVRSHGFAGGPTN